MEFLFGLLTGILSALLGIGGGVFLVPTLVFFAYPMTQAISMSVVMMFFTSIYGSYINYKNDNGHFKDGVIIGAGGFIGGMLSFIISTNVTQTTLWYMFLFVIIISLIKTIYQPHDLQTQKEQSHNYYLLFVIGISIGMFGISLGIGGSMILVPLLFSVLKYDIKTSAGLGLLFVVFSSLGGIISQILQQNLLLQESIYITFGGLIGIFIGMKLKQISSSKILKIILVILNIVILLMILNNLFKII